MQNSYLMKECITGKETDFVTRASVNVTADYLCFEFVAANYEPHPYGDSYNQPLFKGDIVEILLSLQDKQHYLEIEINQNNALYAALVYNRDNKGDIEIDLLSTHSIEYVVSIDKEFWCTSVKLPIQWLKSIGYCGNSYFNMLREDFNAKGDMDLYCISPTYCDTFHITSAFIKL